jgi:hypothetical protein
LESRSFLKRYSMTRAAAAILSKILAASSLRHCDITRAA